MLELGYILQAVQGGQKEAERLGLALVKPVSVEPFFRGPGAFCIACEWSRHM